MACQNNNRRLVELLLVRGANINHQNAQGNAALHFALAFDPEGSLSRSLVISYLPFIILLSYILRYTISYLLCILVLNITQPYDIHRSHHDTPSFSFPFSSFLLSTGLLGEYLIEHGADDTVENVEGLTCYDGVSGTN